MLKNETCKRLCDSTIPAADAGFVNQAIKDHYAVNWLIDGLPAAELKKDDGSGETFYSIGFSLGQAQESMPALHNHYNIFLEYHVRNGNYRVVGALVWPASLDSKASETCNLESGQSMHLNEESDNSVPYTYNVIWTVSPLDFFGRLLNQQLHGLQDGTITYIYLIQRFIGSPSSIP